MSNLIKSWNDRTIRIRGDRYVSLTDMAKATGKRLNNWIRSNSAKSYLEALSSNTRISVTDLLQITQGGTPENQGTWGHPKVAIRFAQWCSDDFAIQVDTWIDELLTTGQVAIAQPQTRPIGAYIERVKSIYENSHNVPKGYWTVLSEASGLLLWVETVLKLPVDKFDLMDGSIGICWANYRVDKSWACDRKQYDYQFPDGRKVKAWSYHYSEMIEFRTWLESVYKKSLMPPYLLKKYGSMVHISSESSSKLRSVA